MEWKGYGGKEPRKKAYDILWRMNLQEEIFFFLYFLKLITRVFQQINFA